MRRNDGVDRLLRKRPAPKPIGVGERRCQLASPNKATILGYVSFVEVAQRRGRSGLIIVHPAAKRNSVPMKYAQIGADNRLNAVLLGKLAEPVVFTDIAS